MRVYGTLSEVVSSGVCTLRNVTSQFTEPRYSTDWPVTPLSNIFREWTGTLYYVERLEQAFSREAFISVTHIKIVLYGC